MFSVSINQENMRAMKISIGLSFSNYSVEYKLKFLDFKQ